MPKAFLPTRYTYFDGLNALRFFAATLVVLMHMKNNLTKMGLPRIPEWCIFGKGLEAVSFFFVLSGFLITYILLKETEKTGTVHIKRFYLKRVFRIWPLYFIIVGFGCLFFWYLAPAAGIDFPVEYDKGLAVFLYVFFGANLINSLYHMGGILHVTWSIAVEEQFYLFWAPLMKKGQKHLPLIFATVFLLFLSLNILNAYNVFGLSKGWKDFVHTLQFHYMALGGWIAWRLFRNPDRLLKAWVFRSKVGQALCLSVLLGFLMLYTRQEAWEPWLIVPKGLLFAWIILNVSVNPRKLFGLNLRPLNYLGQISYGIYMYHMIVIYAVSFLSLKVVHLLPGPLFYLFYVGLVLGLTILIAALSWHVVERHILRFGRKVIHGQAPKAHGTVATPA
ncbi:MAG: acyltransferase [Bacteroidota bacterium]